MSTDREQHLPIQGYTTDTVMATVEAEYADEENDIFQSLEVIDDDEDQSSSAADEQIMASTAPQHESSNFQYQDKKPKWWRQLAGRRGSKAQRRVLRTMESHQLVAVPHGDMHDLAFSSDEIWLEIGCGQGHVLLANAERNPNVGMIGADVHNPGIGSTLLRIEAALEQNQYWKDYSVYSTSKDPFVEGDDVPECEEKETSPSVVDVEVMYSNVRVYPGDGMKLLHALPTSSLSVILITFPDPWYKPDCKQFRVIQNHTVRDLHRVLRQGGRFMLATDHIVFFEWTLQLFASAPELFAKVTPCPDRSTWLPVISKYEQKGWDEGRQTFLACWETKKQRAASLVNVNP
jgi:tRNA (guanine-N7-)-methyltransferase